MRIITGTAKGKNLVTLPGESTRPTAAKVKEAVFSALQFELEGRRVLDLFAGSGQMGLESMSRGAEHVMFVDASAEAISVVKENARRTGFFDQCRYLISDYRSYLRKAAGRDRYHLIFLDPPYALSACADALERILEADLAMPHCVFVLESENEDIFADKEALASRFSLRKATRYGRTWIHILDLKEIEKTDQ